MTLSRFEPTGRLADRVLDGEVVFFIGSGFSVDSERNTAGRLVARLLAGLLAMGTVLSEEGEPENQGKRALDSLGQVFGLAEATRAFGAPLNPARCMTDANIKLLAREYYNFNEWAVSAFGVLSTELLNMPAELAERTARRIEQLANFLLGLAGDAVPLEPMNLAALRQMAEAPRGKALFLDMMGFADKRVMGGNPRAPEIERMAASYADRIRPRHLALARLAREGLAPSMVTTNYDLLLEGAYRIAGLEERLAADSGEASDGIPRYTSIAAADQFFDRGKGFRTSLLLKIHGCVQAYRDARCQQLKALETGVPAGAVGTMAGPWTAYLPALVFTYREIQTWRADAWSRDLIRTFLRTNTLALCGYSGADPVMHSTFREVYEERAHARGPEPPKGSRDPSNAPVFFFGFSGRREFHSLEILRAATEAGGYTPGKLSDHPNQIEFERAGGFPTIDDHFRWLSHRVVRCLQQDALRAQLRRLAPRLLGHPCSDDDFNAITRRFAELCRREEERVNESGMDQPGKSVAERRRVFDQIVPWTWHFVPGLVRELTLAELVGTQRGPGRLVRSRRAVPAYEPITQHQDLAAWAAIVELAIRSLVAVWRESPDDVLQPCTDWLSAEESAVAALSFARGESARQRSALCIRLAGFERSRRRPPIVGAFRRIACWEFTEQDVPWPAVPRGYCPPPNDLWCWAAGETAPSDEAAADHLGGAA